MTPEEIHWRPLPQTNNLNAILQHLCVEAQWERVLIIHHGDMFYPRVIRKHVHGLLDNVPASFWNVWLVQ